MMLACRSLGDGKLMPVRLLIAYEDTGSPVQSSVHGVRVAGEGVFGDYKDGREVEFERVG